jgi:hypothetical protein
VAEAAAQFEDLALGGFEGLAQLVDFVAVLLFERGQLGGEGANDAARGVGVGRGRCRWWGGLLVGPQVFDAVADRGAAIDEVQGDAGGLGQAAEGDRLVEADHLAQSLLGASLGCGAFADSGVAKVVGVAAHAGHLASGSRVMASMRASTPAPRRAATVPSASLWG